MIFAASKTVFYVLLTVVILFLLYLGLVFVLCLVINKIYFRHRFTYDLLKPADTACFPFLSQEDYSFKYHAATIKGHCYYVKKDFKKTVVLAHGFGSNHLNYLPEIANMARKGYTVFAYDVLGTCLSEGKGLKGDITFVAVLEECIKDIKRKHIDADITLYGHSMGAFAVCNVIRYVKVNRVIAIAPYDTSENIIAIHFKKKFGKGVFLLKEMYQLLNFFIFGKKAFLDSYQSLNKTDIPVLVLHGTKDPTVPYDIWTRKEISNPKVKFVSVLNKGHYPLFTFDALFYMDRLNDIKNKLKLKYKNKVPEDIIASFNQEVEHDKRFAFDPDVISVMEDFLRTTENEVL